MKQRDSQRDFAIFLNIFNLDVVMDIPNLVKPSCEKVQILFSSSENFLDECKFHPAVNHFLLFGKEFISTTSIEHRVPDYVADDKFKFIKNVSRMISRRPKPVYCDKHHIDSKVFCLIEGDFWRKFVEAASDGKNVRTNEELKIDNTKLYEAWTAFDVRCNLCGSEASMSRDCTTNSADFFYVTDDAWISLVSWYGGGPRIQAPLCCLSEIFHLKSPDIITNESFQSAASASSALHSDVKNSLSINNCFSNPSTSTATSHSNGVLPEVAVPTVCAACASLSPDLKLRSSVARLRCKKCTVTHYCSAKCQKSHWHFHRLECVSPTDRNAATSSVARRVTPGKVGLENIGNSCYLSSSIQALSHIEPLTRWLISDKYLTDINPDNMDGSEDASLVRDYADLLKHLWFGLAKSIPPYKIKTAIGRLNEDYIGAAQHDAHDLLELLLDRYCVSAKFSRILAK